MLRDFLHALFRLLFRLFTDLTITGIENVPAQGGTIVAANHLGILDAPLIFAVLERRDTTALVAKKHRKNPFLRVIVEALDGIWLNREEADTQAIRAAVAHLQAGGLLGIAPEGTRSPTGSLGYAKMGLAYLADRAGVPVIPTAITGTYRGVYRLLSGRRLRITVRFGQPFYIPPVERKNRQESLQKATVEIMDRIVEMLPPEYWGVYDRGEKLKEPAA